MSHVLKGYWSFTRWFLRRWRIKFYFIKFRGLEEIDNINDTIMMQLIIQFQKYILSIDYSQYKYIYISFYLRVFLNWKWFQSIDELFTTIRFLSRIRHVIPFHTHTHARAHATSDRRSGRELFPFSIHVSCGDVLEESDASSLPRKIGRMGEKGKREQRKGRDTERGRETIEFFFSGPWRVESARLKYRAGGIMLRQRWVNGDVDRRKFHSAHGRARRSMFQLGEKWKNRWNNSTARRKKRVQLFV